MWPWSAVVPLDVLSGIHRVNRVLDKSALNTVLELSDRRST